MTNVIGERIVTEAQAVKAWYKRSTFWGQAAAGAIIWQVLRTIVYVLGLHLPL